MSLAATSCEVVSTDDVLDGLYTWRIAQTPEVQALMFPHHRDPGAAWGALESLRRAGLVNKTTVGRPRRDGGRGWERTTRWWPSPAGYVRAEAMGRVKPREYRLNPQHARGNWDHTFAGHWVHAAISTAARDRGDRCGPLDVHREVAHPLVPKPANRRLSHWVIVDLVARYDRADGAHMVRWIEVDMGNETVGELVGTKLARYAAMSRARIDHELAWQNAYPQPPDERQQRAPKLIVVFARSSKLPTLRSMQSRRESVMAQCLATGLNLDVRFTLLPEFVEAGPWAPVFRMAGCNRWLNWTEEP